MADASFQVTSFIGGEWSQSMQGRADDPRYRTAMNICLNGMMLETGAWIRRPGFLFAGRTPGGRPTRVVPFNFTSIAPYSMEFSDGLIRFRNGQTLALFNHTFSVVSISTSNPAVVRTSEPHGLATGNYGVFGNLGTSMPILQNRTLQATAIDAFTFSIADDVDGPVDGSTLGALPVGVTWRTVQQITTTYAKNTSNDWANIRVIQAETQAILLNGSEPQIVTALTQPEGATFASFDYRNVVFRDGPYLDPFNGNDFNQIGLNSIGLTPTGTTGIITLTAAQLDTNPAPAIFASTDVGRQMRLFSAPPTYQVTGTYVAGAFVSFNGQVFQNTSGHTVTPGGQPDITPSIWSLATGLRALWIYGIITAVNSSTSVQFHILGPGDFGIAYTTPIEFWRLGVYSDTTGWPTCGCYHEGRVYLGGAVSNRFDASTSDGLASGSNILIMSPTDVAGNVADSSGISYTLEAKDVNQILWMEPDQQGILCGTKGGEWLVQATTQNLPLSPTNIQAHRYTTVGCANIEPRRADLTLVFVQKFGRKIMEFFPDVFSGRFTAPNLTQTAKHLTVTGLQELAYQQELAPTVWVRRADGALLGCTYKRENLMARELPTFAGWHHHALGSGRVIESICVAGNADGTLDTLVVVTNDPATNVRWVEVLSDLPDETDPITAAWNVDGSVAPSSYQTVTIGDTPVNLQINGLWHLNGKTVTVWTGGMDVGDYQVTNGSVSVPFGDGINAGPHGTSDRTGPWNAGGGAYLLTPAFVNSFNGAMPMAVGFTYTSQGQILRPASREDSGARNGPAFAKKRRSAEYAVQVVNGQGISIGTDFSNMKPAYFKSKSGNNIPVNQLYTGIHWDTLADDYSFDSMLAWQLTRPYPATIASIGGFPHTQDR